METYKTLSSVAGRVIAPLLLLFLGIAPSVAGEMHTIKMESSLRYPGTARTFDVFIPRQYAGDRPACLLVRMDGQGHNLPDIIEELIDEGSMPVTIAVFMRPGRICDSAGNVVRYNRSNEFDRMTPTWAEFLEEEVLPLVEELVASNGCKVRISRNPADRAITGDSSGGIAAFTAAWERPDLYSRVYSIVGTFVPFRGGDSYPALIRKSEPKPIRIFLQDNDEDSWNRTFGSWYEHNLMMASALRFAGYDLETRWDSGGHSGTNGGRIMKDVMRWLWRGWPEPVSARKGENELINELLIEGEGWMPCTAKAPKKRRTEALYPGGAFIARPKPHTNAVATWIIDEKGKERFGEDFYWLHNEGGRDDGDRELAFDTDGWLYVSSALGIQVCDQNGRVRAIISVPHGELQRFWFEGDRLFVCVEGKNWSRRINHSAATKNSPRPASQGQG